MRDDSIGSWILGEVIALLGLFALFLARATQDRVFYSSTVLGLPFSSSASSGLIHRHVGR
jgi:hypothetical protein